MIQQFKECGRSRGKTKIWVTNQVSYLPQVDQIILMKDGSVCESGNYVDLMNRKGIFHDFVQQGNQHIDHPVSLVNCKNSKSDVSDGRLNEEHESITRLIPMDMSEGRLVEDEKCLTGHVPLYVFKDFIKKMGSIFFVLFLVTNGLEQGLHAGGILWISHWSDDSRLNSTHANDEASYRLGNS